MSDEPKKIPVNKEQELEKKLVEIKEQEIEEKAKRLAQGLKLQYLDLTVIPVNRDAVFLIPEDQARKANLAAIDKAQKMVKIALIDPQDVEAQKIIKNLELDGYKTTLFVVSIRSLNNIWKTYKEKSDFSETKLGLIQLKEQDISEIKKQIQNINDLKEKISKISTTELIETLMAGGLKLRASDIHFEPEEHNVRLRYRIDGVLQDITNIEKEGHESILSRIKIMSGLKINVRNRPQDGRFTIREQDVDIEVRVSVMPSSYGETTVMRLLDPRSIKQDLADLGLRPDLLDLVKKQLERSTGSILTTGPTGSGKTTTLYAFLRYVNKPGTKIITIENPVEYHLEGISQTQVDPEHGYDFANGLRAIVRQDPDVILVGEIRDEETAEIAMNAALTGHLVFSTLHTNDSAGTIPRLEDLGVRPHIIAPALNMAMAQRLIRRLCDKCKVKEKIQKAELEELKESLKTIPKTVQIPELNENLEICRAKSCAECNFTGYRDRIGVFEAFIIDRDIEKLILKSPAISEVRDLAIQKGMITMAQDAYLKVLSGTTDFEEVRRIL